MDKWTRQFYQNELKEIYRPEEIKKPEKKLLDEIREQISLKKMKIGLFKTFKKVLMLFLILSGIALLFVGGGYFILKYYLS